MGYVFGLFNISMESIMNEAGTDAAKRPAFKVPKIMPSDNTNALTGITQALQEESIIEESEEELDQDYIAGAVMSQEMMDGYRQELSGEEEIRGLANAIKKGASEYVNNTSLADASKAIADTAYGPLEMPDEDAPPEIKEAFLRARNKVIGEVVEFSNVSRSQAIAAYEVLMAELAQAKERDNAELGKYSTLGSAAERMRALGADPLVDTVNFARSLEQELIFQLKCRAGLITNKLGLSVKYSAAVHSAVMATYSKTLETLMKYAYLTAEQGVVREEKKLERDIAVQAIQAGANDTGLIIQISPEASIETPLPDIEMNETKFKPVVNNGPNRFIPKE
jgi:hypothetical protein